MSTRDARARGVRTAIVSSSQNCAAVLDAAGLTQLFDVRVDGIDLRRLGLAGKPAPDMFLEAARQLETPDRSRTGGPPHARSGPQCEPHAAPSNRDPRPSSPAPCRLKAKGYLLPEFYSGATGRSGRFNEGLLLRRLQTALRTGSSRPGRGRSAGRKTERDVMLSGMFWPLSLDCA